MIYRLFAYSFILLGTLGTFYLGVEGITGNRDDLPMMSIESLGRQLLDSNAITLIDVRTAAEMKAAPAPWAVDFFIPLADLEDRCPELAEYKDQKILLLCPSGNRSRQGARILNQAGFDAWYLEHGIESSLRVTLESEKNE